MNAQLGEMVGGDLDEETFLAWGNLVFRPFVEEVPPPDPREIARILRLGRQVPRFVQDWLADLIDPPPDSVGELKFELKRSGRGARRLETAWNEYQKSLAIRAAMERGKTLSGAISEVMPGKQRQGYRPWKSTQRVFEVIEEVSDKIRR
jgi:hypothetical protein